jgi:formaldehyde-activating enzyme
MVPLKNMKQANMVYGPGQAGVGKAIFDEILSGKITVDSMATDLMLVCLSIHPRAADHHTLFRNVYQAMCRALGEAVHSIAEED